MRIVVSVIKVYEVETEGGDTTDPEAVKAHCHLAESMQSTEIEKQGTLQSAHVDYAEVVGPSDEEN